MMHRTPRIRLFIAALGIAGVFFLPWWVSVIAAVLLALRYPAPETVLIGVLSDLAWLPGSASAHLPYMTLASIIVVWAFEPIRREFLESDVAYTFSG